MNQEFENKNDDIGTDNYVPPSWLSGNKHPLRVSPEDVQDVLYSPVNADDNIQPGIPLPESSQQTQPVASPVQIQSTPPTPQPTGYAPSGVPEWSFRRRSEMRSAAQAEPSYREAGYRTANENMSNMYTPGISTNRQYAGSYNRRSEDAAPAAPVPPKKSGRGRRFLRAMCLVLICALVSAAATYGVMEYRIRAGYHTVVNQVVLGGTGIADPGETRPTPITSSETGMRPEYIYDMALSQVVGIKIEVPTLGVFGTIGSSTAAGSGFIISDDGYILTNFHVIEPAQTNQLPINVIKSDGSEFVAEVIGYEVANDVALLKIEATGLNPVILGNSDNIRVGQTVFAIGNPFGNLVYTMTDGIVSALDREVTVEGIIINTFQFSAAVNRGNSGGPIYNANGEVIGIVTAKMARNDVEGIGFAVPINDAIEIASGLIEYGYITGRPMLGITGQTVSRSLAEYYDLVVGVFVRTVNPGSAAQRAGLEDGDIIVGLGDTEISSMDMLRFVMRSYRAGETTHISVWRDGAVIEMPITFDEDLAAGQPGRSQSVPIEQDESEGSSSVFPRP